MLPLLGILGKERELEHVPHGSGLDPMTKMSNFAHNNSFFRSDKEKWKNRLLRGKKGANKKLLPFGGGCSHFFGQG